MRPRKLDTGAGAHAVASACWRRYHDRGTGACVDCQHKYRAVRHEPGYGVITHATCIVRTVADCPAVVAWRREAP